MESILIYNDWSYLLSKMLFPSHPNQTTIKKKNSIFVLLFVRISYAIRILKVINSCVWGSNLMHIKSEQKEIGN